MIRFNIGFQKGRYEFLVAFLSPFGDEIRWCFAVSEASQTHIACALEAGKLQDGAKSWKRLKTIRFNIGFQKGR